MTALSAWSPLTLFVVVVGYVVVAGALIVAPMVMPLLREARKARQERRDPTFVPFEPYPVYVFRFRRAFRLLVVPPALLVAAWFLGKMR